MRRLNHIALWTLLALAVFLWPSSLLANQSASGWCQAGATIVVTSGLSSANQVMGSFPQCLVTVNIHGAGLAMIFSDNVGTVLANPFVAQTGGQFQFYAANGRYDIVISGAGISTPVTFSDILLNDPAAPSTLVSPTITNPTITGTVTGGATYVLPLFTSPTTTGTDIGVETLNNKTLVSPVITGTVTGGASYTSPALNTPTITSPTTTGTDTGSEILTNKTLTAPAITNPSTTGTDSGTETLVNKTLTAPAITSPVVTGTESGTRTDSGAISFTGNNSHAGTESFTGAVPVNFYVTTTGSDSNSCLSVPNACLTVQHAANVAMSYVFAGVSATVNILTGTFQGPTLSGFLMGNAGPNVNTAFLVLNGNGAANTILNDTMSHTYVIDVSGGMQVIVENMNVSVPANETGIFAQLPGSFVIVTGTNTFTGAAVSSIALHAEDFSAISLQNGTLTTNGSFAEFATLGFDGQLGTTSTTTINCGSVTTFSTAFTFLDGNSSALFNNLWSGCGSVTGTQYSIGGNSYISNLTASHLPGNGIGQVYAGGRYRPSPTITATESDGHLGTGGSVTVATGSGSHGGILTLNTGSASTSSSGVVAFNWAEQQIITGGGAMAPCTASPQSGATAWNAQAVMQIAINTFAGGLQIQWSNNAVNLTTGTTYAISYTCNGDI